MGDFRSPSPAAPWSSTPRVTASTPTVSPPSPAAPSWSAARPTSGNGALDVNGDFTVDGGMLVAAGSAGHGGRARHRLQAGLGVGDPGLAVAAGTVIQIVNSDNEVVATYATSKTVQNVVVSTAAITSGDAYTVYTGGTASGDTTGGLSAGGELGSATTAPSPPPRARRSRGGMGGRGPR